MSGLGSRAEDAGVLSEDENIELTEGEIVVMAAKGYAHEMIKAAPRQSNY